MPVHLAYYLAPDQAHRGMAPSPRSDVYALGVMLYEALTGYVPFGGDDVYQVVRGHLMDPPPPPRGLVPDLPWHVEAVVLRALAKHPDDRIESSHELALYLRGCASGAIVPSPQAPAVTPVPAAPTPAGGNGIRIRREGPPPSPPAVTPLPMTPGPLAPPDAEEDVPTQVRSLADFPDMDDADLPTDSLPADGPGGEDHEDTNPSLSIIDDDDLILMEEPDPGVSAVSDLEATTPASPAPLADSEPAPAELPDGVPNPSYLALLAPRR
jgi:serine/threonine protein kinase